jgi:hypothetical protein
MPKIDWAAIPIASGFRNELLALRSEHFLQLGRDSNPTPGSVGSQVRLYPSQLSFSPRSIAER